MISSDWPDLGTFVRVLLVAIAMRGEIPRAFAEDRPRAPVGLPDLSAFSKKGGVGMALDQRGEDFVVEEVDPGLPAAEQKEIAVGDRIVSVAQGDGPAVPVRGLELNQVINLIRGPVGSTVRITMVPTGRDDSQARTVSLVRAAMGGAEPALRPGEAAPKLSVGRWIQGEPVASFETDKVYLVEFWATWCGPCVESIPHLDALHRKFKDRGLVVIGQNVWEKDQKLVRPFVEKMGEKMTYRVALDDMSGSPGGAMSAAWLQPADGKSIGIPAAFLVGRDGRIVWVAHPLELTDELIEVVLSSGAGQSGDPPAKPDGK